MLLKAKLLVYVQRRYVQALFVGKKNAVGNVRALTPILDYKYRLKNRTELEDNLRRRGVLKKIEIDNLYTQWESFKNAEAKKDFIEKRRAHLSESIFQINSIETLSATDQGNVEKYKQESRALRNQYKDVCKYFHDIEEEFINTFLALPNKLLPNTPNDSEIVSSYGTPHTGTELQHHLQSEQFMEFTHDGLYFLRNEAAKFDFEFPLKCLDYFQQRDYIQFKNAEFAKTVIIEGAGIPLDSLYEVTHSFHENCSNLVHLVGSGSWLSFLGFMANIKIDKASLPMQFISAGKIYQPINTHSFSLFDASQSTAVQIFLAGTQEQMNDKFNKTLELISQIYKMIDIHFRIVHVAANQLQPAECFAARFEMYSPFLKKYIEIGRLSNFSNYISKRLQLQCERDGKNRPRIHILCGTICNVTKLLGIILETHNGTIPKSISSTEFC